MSEQLKQEDKLLVRLPVGTIDRIRKQAEQHQRSINGETVWAILRYLEGQEKEQRDHAQDV